MLRGYHVIAPCSVPMCRNSQDNVNSGNKADSLNGFKAYNSISA